MCRPLHQNNWFRATFILKQNNKSNNLWRCIQLKITKQLLITVCQAGMSKFWVVPLAGNPHFLTLDRNFRKTSRIGTCLFNTGVVIVGQRLIKKMTKKCQNMPKRMIQPLHMTPYVHKYTESANSGYSACGELSTFPQSREPEYYVNS